MRSNQHAMYHRLLVKKWTENERFGVEQGGTADLNGLRDLYTVEPPAYHRL